MSNVKGLPPGEDGDTAGGTSLKKETSSTGSSHSLSSTSVESEGKTAKQDIADLCAHLARLGRDTESTIMAPKQTPGKVGSQVSIATNVYGVKTAEVLVYNYDAEVIGVSEDGKKIEFTKNSKNDYITVSRKMNCLKAFEVLSAREKAFDGACAYYDGQKCIFTLRQFDFKTNTFTLTPAEVGLEGRRLTSVQFKVSEVATNKVFSLRDFKVYSRDLRKTDTTLERFINIATSQVAILNPFNFACFNGGVSYLKQPWDYGFTQRDCPNLAEGKYIGVGLHKSSMPVEGPRGPGAINVALAVDTAKTAFHDAINLLEKATRIVPSLLNAAVRPEALHQLRQQLKGLFVQTRVSEKCNVFQIDDVSAQSAVVVTFECDGKKITVQNYYKEKYNISLEHPNAPLVVNKKGGRQNYYPMELCTVTPDQRVQQKQQTPAQLKGMKDACIMPPAERKKQTELNVEALKLLNPENPYVSAANMTITQRPLTVDARILPPPSVLYGHDKTIDVDPIRMWSLGRNLYVKPVEIKSWAIYVLSGGREIMRPQEVEQFAMALMKTATDHGIRMKQPDDMNSCATTPAAIAETICQAGMHGCEFIFFLQSDSLSLHDVIKDSERKYEVVTQDMKVSKAMDVIKKNKWQTLENVVNKMNVKLGGLNYQLAAPRNSPSWMRDGRLIIGIATSHAGPMVVDEMDYKSESIPSAVGYSSNFKSDFEFVGDFAFQGAGRTDDVDVLRRFFGRIIRNYRKTRGKYPIEVVVYRSGVSEGQFSMLLRGEVQLMRETMKRCKCPDVKLTVIVVNKMHKVRLTPTQINARDRPMDQNIKLGTVVDTQLVHPIFNEFYLNSHKALQGSAKTPRYTVVVDDSSLAMDELEGLTFSLCFGHQIVSLSTSLPTPLYVATRYADRGRRLYVQRSGGSDQMSVASGEAQRLTAKEASVNLSYAKTTLGDKRINA